MTNDDNDPKLSPKVMFIRGFCKQLFPSPYFYFLNCFVAMQACSLQLTENGEKKNGKRFGNKITIVCEENQKTKQNTLKYR